MMSICLQCSTRVLFLIIGPPSVKGGGGRSSHRPFSSIFVHFHPFSLVPLTGFKPHAGATQTTSTNVSHLDPTTFKDRQKVRHSSKLLKIVMFVSIKYIHQLCYLSLLWYKADLMPILQTELKKDSSKKVQWAL